MARRRYIDVEVSLDEFDEDDIIEEARRIAARRGIAQKVDDLGEEGVYRVRDLACAIARGDPDEALRRLDDLVGEERTLREAIDIGRRCR